MKRGWAWILAACLLLSGCGAGQEEEPQEPEQVPQTEESVTAPEGLTMEMEHPVYDPSLDTYTYFICNDTDETVDFGEDYTLQRRDGDGWTDLTMREDAAWVLIGYSLEPGRTMALTCSFALYEEAPQAGEYRLVKTVEDTQLTAEFALGESIYTAQTPYGFGPLEELPERYGAADAAGSGAVIFTGSGEENLQAVEEFLDKVSLDVPCQLRTVQDQGEGVPMVIDVIYEGGNFLWRMRSGGTEVTERRLSYLVTDGTDLYLSDGADWETGEQYGDQRIFLVPPLRGTAWVADVETMTADRLAGNVTRYKAWSADGLWSASLEEEPTAFSAEYHGSDGSWSRSYDLKVWDGLETEITGLSWEEDDILKINCKTTEGDTAVLTFNLQTERLTASPDNL